MSYVNLCGHLRKGTNFYIKSEREATIALIEEITRNNSTLNSQYAIVPFVWLEYIGIVRCGSVPGSSTVSQGHSTGKGSTLEPPRGAAANNT